MAVQDVEEIDDDPHQVLRHDRDRRQAAREVRAAVFWTAMAVAASRPLAITAGLFWPSNDAAASMAARERASTADMAARGPRVFCFSTPAS
jgi:hypothetical protein